jgi:hypothetical protein
MSSNQQPNQTDGPYLAAAFFCQHIIEDKRDGAFSCIRLIDRVEASSTEETMPILPIQLNAFVSFKSGNFEGDTTAKITMVDPSGKVREPTHELPLHFQGSEHGNNLTITFNLNTNQVGLYWFHVVLGDVFMTRIPLRVSYVQMKEQKTEATNLEQNAQTD